MSNFVLLSDRVPGIEQIKNSIKCAYLVFSRFSSNTDIDTFFTENDLSNISRFAFLYENDNITITFFPSDNEYFGNQFSYFLSKLVALNSSIIVDIITCNINRPEQKARIATLETLYNIDIRYSLNESGDYRQGGDWLMESDNVNIKDDYFNENINDWHYTLQVPQYYIGGLNKVMFDISNNPIYLHTDISDNPINKLYDASGYNIKYSPGELVVWGTTNGVTITISNNVQYNNVCIAPGTGRGSFITIKTDGSLGFAAIPDAPNTLLTSSGFIAAYPTDRGYVALTNTGNIYAWDIFVKTTTILNLGSPVKYVCTDYGYTATALKQDGTIYTFGNQFAFGGNNNGGVYNNSTLLYSVSNLLQSNIAALYSNYGAYAVIKSNGSVVAWGQQDNGGDLLSPINVSGNLQSNVKCIYNNYYAFAALKTDGSVVAWGNITNGGDMSAVSVRLQSGVKTIYGNQFAFAALKTDGSVVTWGLGIYGGNSSSVSAQLQSNVAAIYYARESFIALKTNGSIVSWGIYAFNSTISAQLQSNVISVTSNRDGYAALKMDGSVVTWGTSSDSTSVSSLLQSGVRSIYANINSFAALKTNGSVVTWPNTSTDGGNSSSVSGKLQRFITTIVSSPNSFAALYSPQPDGGTLVLSGPTIEKQMISLQDSLYNL